MISYEDYQEGRVTLTVVLTEGLPDCCGEKGWISPTKLSSELGCTKNAVTLWLSHNKLPASRVDELMALRGSKLNRDKLMRFVDIV